MKLPTLKSPLLEERYNGTFHGIVEDDIISFVEHITLLKSEILKLWDNQNIPPYIGKSESEIIKSFQKLKSYDVSKFWFEDKNYPTFLGFIKNFVKLGSEVNQFFPYMLKTKINGRSMYDWFSDDELETEFNRIMVRAFKMDGMFLFTKYLKLDKNVELDHVKTFENFKSKFSSKNVSYYFEKCLTPLDKNESEDVYLSQSDIDYLSSNKLITDYDFRNVFEVTENEKVYGYRVRIYDRHEKIFPNLIQVFRLGLGQPPVNFPPLTARFIYEKFLSDLKQDHFTVYDPCSGWGGRLLGSLSSQLNIHYVGTDVNSNNFGCYEALGDFYHKYCGGKMGRVENTYHMFRCGSETIHKMDEFKQYKGKLDLCFTSPPYFNKEIYSQDVEQAINSYPQYKLWKNKFLKQTMSTCYEYLKPNRNLLLNISDIKLNNRVVPLEQDTISIAIDLGFKYVGKIGMVMTRMIGLQPKNLKNSWFDETTMTDYKVEPILIFEKN